ncbi:MAG: outer membrane lipoprotein-sorting protein [Bacteroidales bacterium]|jgi:hypothetical protein|nr:outer membrane lipoprotein-sorting protein [Bacteroidales bacterium]
MKRILLIVTFILAATVISAQSLENIVKKYTVANKLDQTGSIKTLKITGSMSMMGMEMPMEIWMKNPDKIKTVTNINGQEMIQLYDGERGYMINPMTGSSDPVEMGPDEVKNMLRSNVFQNYLDNFLKNGQLALDGEETVNGSATYKIKATIEGGTVLNLFIDKVKYLLVKTTATVNSKGMSMTLESYPSDYKETNGILLPMKTTTSASGMEFVTSFTKVEVDIPMDNSVFKAK